MKVTAISAWFGSKRTLAPRIVEQLGKHTAYWEPFCGSMAVLLAKPKVSSETLYDLHGDLINLAKTIQHPAEGPRLYRRLRRTWAHEQLFREAAEAVKGFGNQWDGVLDPDRAYSYFICSWLGRNGVQGTQSYNQGYCRRFTKNGGHQGTRWVNVVDSVPAFNRRLRGVSIECVDALECVPKIEDAAGVAIYADPPYLVKGASYVHDFADADHARLAEQLGRFQKARVVVSYYDDPRLGELYPGFAKVHCPVAKAMVQAGKRDKAGVTMAPEVLLVNGGRVLPQAGDLF